MRPLGTIIIIIIIIIIITISCFCVREWAVQTYLASRSERYNSSDAPEHDAGRLMRKFPK